MGEASGGGGSSLVKSPGGRYAGLQNMVDMDSDPGVLSDNCIAVVSASAVEANNWNANTRTKAIKRPAGTSPEPTNRAVRPRTNSASTNEKQVGDTNSDRAFYITANAPNKIPYNFLNKILQHSDVIQLIDTDSLELVGAGAAIQGAFKKDADITKVSFPFEIKTESATYQLKQPRKAAKFVGEIHLPISDLGDKALSLWQILNYSATLQFPVI